MVTFLNKIKELNWFIMEMNLRKITIANKKRLSGLPAIFDLPPKMKHLPPEMVDLRVEANNRTN